MHYISLEEVSYRRFMNTIIAYPSVFDYSIYGPSFSFKLSGMSGKPDGTTGNNSSSFYIYTVFCLYYYVKKTLSLSFAGQIERGESMPSVETLALLMCKLNIDPRLIFIDGDTGSSSEYDELYLLLRRMSVSQRKPILDFAKIIRSYEIM